MKRCILLIHVLLLTCVLVLTGCSKTEAPQAQTSESKISAGVYYISGSGSDLIAEKTEIPDTSRKGQLKYLIDQLISPPAGKTSPLCDGTKLNSVTIKDDVAVVDFSKEFSNKDDLKQTLAPAAVAKTLCTAGLYFRRSNFS